MVVHELRAPLSVITMGLGSLLGKANDASRHLLAMMTAEAERLDRMIAQVRSFTGPLQLRAAVVEPSAFLEQAMPVLHALPEARDRTLLLSLPRAPVLVRADRDLLLQALINLVRNACEASPVGGTVRILARQDGAHLEIGVHNHAVIDAKVLERLPGAFVTTRRRGTGLGLAIVDRIAGAHGGRLEIESGESRGTTVTLRLPLLAR
jgi:signal transduction histidine kinase